MKTKLILVGVITFLVCNQSCNSPESSENQQSATETDYTGQGQASVVDNVSDPNVLQLAQSMDDFSTLVAAIKAAGVEDAVVNAGPLTVFAPLNTAFDKLPEGTVETLLKPENKAKLAFVLTNHVAPSNYPIEQLKKEAEKGRKLYMASGEYLECTVDGDKVFVGGIEILKSVKVSNGWVHVIDDVIVPQNMK